MKTKSNKLAIYALSGLMGLTSLFGGFSYEPNTKQIQEPARAEQVVKAPASKLEQILSSVKFGPKAAYAKEVGQYAAPSLEGYTLDKVVQRDKDEIKNGINETTIEYYKNSQGQLIGKYIAKDKVWAWYVRNNDDTTDNVNNYVIRDSDGNGVFNERYGRNEDFYLPAYLK